MIGPGAIGFQRRPDPSIGSNTTSVDFAGDNDYITIGQPSDINLTPNAAAITISAWFRPTDITAQRFIVSKAKMSIAEISYVMAVNNDGSVYAQVGGTGNGSGSLTVNTWNHMLLTVRNVTGTWTFFLFLNGVQVGTGVCGASNNTDMDWLIGASRWDTNSSDSYPFQGQIDEVTWWTTEFTNADVTELYNANKPTNPRTHSKASWLRHWYRMGDGDTYPTVTDRVGSANGTCTNMAGAGNFVAQVP